MSIIVVAGRFAKNAEIRSMPDGTQVASFSIAENIYNGQTQTSQFWECSLFGKRAESISKYILKGGAATVYGEPRQQKYTGKDGIERTVTKIRVNDIVLQGSRSQNESEAPPKQTQQRSQQYTADDIDDDIPF